MVDPGGACLTNRQRLFVEHYLTCWNATKAAELAGYKHPRQAGSRLLSNVVIQAAIKARLAEKAMAADEVLARLADVARGSLAEFVHVDEEGKVKLDLSDESRLHLLKKVKLDGDGLQIELYSKLEALRLIGQHHKLFTQMHELDVPQLEPLPELLRRMVDQVYGEGGDD